MILCSSDTLERLSESTLRSLISNIGRSKRIPHTPRNWRMSVSRIWPDIILGSGYHGCSCKLSNLKYGYIQSNASIYYVLVNLLIIYRNWFTVSLWVFNMSLWVSKMSLRVFTWPCVCIFTMSLKESLEFDLFSWWNEGRQRSCRHTEIIVYIVKPLLRIIGRVQFQVKSWDHNGNHHAHLQPCKALSWTVGWS